MEKLIKDMRVLDVDTDPETDQRIMQDALKARKKIISAKNRPNVLRIAKFAAAALIMIAGFIFVTQQAAKEKHEPQKIIPTQKSLSELTTIASMNFAYRREGMKGLNEICDKAIYLAGPRPAKISLKDLLEDFNEKNTERDTEL